MSDTPIMLIKVGGNDLDTPGFLPELAEVVAEMQQTMRVVLVHGGGRTVDKLLAALDIEPQYHEGQRVTSAESLEITEMVLSAQVNKRVTLALLAAGVDALGISGVDRRLITVKPWGGGLGLVGRVTAVRADLIRAWCAEGVVPVISPISHGANGRYNVNADHAAGAVAGAIDADRAIFISNVPGVKVDEQVQPTLTQAEVENLIAAGTIHGGMIPKVRSALAALAEGVPTVVITDLEGLRHGRGTVIQP